MKTESTSTNEASRRTGKTALSPSQGLSTSSDAESLAPDRIEMAARYGKRCSFHHGHVIFNEGDEGDYVYVLVDGVVELNSANRHLTQVLPGEPFGELSFVDHEIRSGTATCLAATTAIRISFQDFDRMLSENYEVARWLMARLTGIIRNLNRVATTDALTGCFSRGHLTRLLRRELARSQRTGAPVSVIFADIDNFKGVNDKHGHMEGDRLLSAIATGLIESIRLNDSVGRFGGDEFFVVLPDTAARSCDKVMSRMLRIIETPALEAINAQLEPASRVSLSLGATDTVSIGGHDPDQLLAAADTATYEAKRQGKGRGIIAAASELIVITR